jgi:hypothetical protein
MNIVRSQQSRGLMQEALISNGDGANNLENVSFMLAPSQREVIKQLARENRFSQGVVLRIIVDEWMQNKLEGC